VGLDIEPEMHDVAVLDYVFLSLQAVFSRGLGGLFTSEGLDVGEIDGLCPTDEQIDNRMPKKRN
jgi:hypothetical protein